MNSKKLSIGNFDKVSVFESTNLILVKFKINFAKKRQFLNQYFYIASDFKDNLFFFLQIRFCNKLCSRKINICSFLQRKKRQNWQFCVFVHRMNLRGRNGMANSFWTKFSITSESSNQHFHNSSISEWEFFSTHQMLNPNVFKTSGFQLELFFQKK